MRFSLAVFSLLVAPAVSDLASCSTVFLEMALSCSGANSTDSFNLELNSLTDANNLRTCYCTTNSDKLQQAATECAGTELEAIVSTVQTTMCDSTCFPDLAVGQTACNLDIFGEEFLSGTGFHPTASNLEKVCSDACRNFFNAGAPTSCQAAVGSEWTSLQASWSTAATELGTGNGKLCNPCMRALSMAGATCPDEFPANTTGVVPAYCSTDCLTGASGILSLCNAADIVGGNISGLVISSTSAATVFLDNIKDNATSIVASCPVPSPPPPPPPSPPPPLTKVNMAITASGTVDDYTTAKIDSISNSVATDVGVDPSLVETTVTAGSVAINSEVTVPQDMEASSVESALNTNWGTAAKASGKLSAATGDTVAVTSDPTMTTVVPSGDDDDGLPIAIIAGAAGGGVALLIIIGVGIYCIMKSSSTKKGPPQAKSPALPLA